MEIVAASFAIILLSCGALAIGQFFGRKPIHGGCTPNSSGHCAHTDSCSRRCLKRKQTDQSDT